MIDTTAIKERFELLETNTVREQVSDAYIPGNTLPFPVP
jgi:hypothetical protein